MENIKIIVSDLDGTIIPKSQKISNEAIQAFKNAQAKNIPILIATGRHYAFIHKDLINALDPDYLVTINGACIVDKKGNIIKGFYLEEDLFNRFVQACIDHDISLCFKFEELMVTYNEHERFINQYIKDDSLKHLIIDDTKNRTYHKKHKLPMGTFIIDDHHHIDEIIPEFPELKFEHSFSDGYDVFPYTTTKKTAIDYVINQLGLKWENVIAFGDAGNDSDMIKNAGIGVAMGNAKDFVKDIADYVTTTVDEDGVKEALIHFGII